MPNGLELSWLTDLALHDRCQIDCVVRQTHCGSLLIIINLVDKWFLIYTIHGGLPLVEVYDFVYIFRHYVLRRNLVVDER